MAVTSREELINYSLRKLGYPVIDINCSEEQISDCVDDAIQKFQEFSSEGNFIDWWRHEISEEDIYNQFIEVPDDIMDIQKMIPFDEMGNGDALFDTEYQMNNQMFGGTYGGQSITEYVMGKMFMSTTDLIFNEKENWRFKRHNGKLYIDADWGDRNWLKQYPLYETGGKIILEQANLQSLETPEYLIYDVEQSSIAKIGDFYPGMILIFEVTRAIDTQKIYNDPWLKKYTTELIRKQWGTNLSKFDGVQLPGGITINGDRLVSEARENIERLDEELLDVYRAPLGVYIG